MKRSERAIDRMSLAELEAKSEILPREFYERPTIEVSRDLLGKVIVHRRTARGLTPRTKVIFGPPGHAYVYFIYGMYECLNLVAEPDGRPGCVLIRALNPICGIATMFRRRPAARKLEDLASGPGKLTLAMGITRAHNGRDVTRGSFVVRKWKQEPPVNIEVTPRIGITKCADWPLRFVLRGDGGNAK
jgi:DNA-3-methyladenine glycosylase